MLAAKCRQVRPKSCRDEDHLSVDQEDKAGDLLIQEVDEDLRREQYLKLWQLYGKYAIAGVIAIVLGVAGHQAWLTWRDRQFQTEAAAYQAAETLLTAGKTSEGIAKLDQIAAGKDGFAMLAAFRRAELQAALAQAHAAVLRAQGALALAEQDLAHCTIRAPVDGVVADRQVQQGDYLQPGSALLSVVPLRTLYVTANFKETQTGRMRAGQPAEISVDALDGESLHGTVESIAPGSGSQFALLPFEPGTGNFTKIVQRVPVRIHLENTPALANLRPGLSATVRVRVGE